MGITDFTHLLAHIVIFSAYLVGVYRIPLSFGTLIRIRKSTAISGSAFFLFCAMTHISLAFNNEHALLFEITNHLQAVAVVAFFILLAQDISRAMDRLTDSFRAIKLRYPDVADEVISMMVTALQGRDRREPDEQANGRRST